MFERIRLTMLAAAVSVFMASCVSERGRYDFSYDCANAEVTKAVLDTLNTRIFKYGNRSPTTDHRARKILDHGTKLGVIKTLGKNEHGYLCGALVRVPSFYDKALIGIYDAKFEYFYRVILTKEGGFVVDGEQRAWFHLDRPADEEPFDVLPRHLPFRLLPWQGSLQTGE